MDLNSQITEDQTLNDYQIVENALKFIAENYLHQPSLSVIAAHVGMSEFHFQRVFSRWAGVSPKRFLQFLTKEHARHLLDNASTILDAAYQSGLSGPGRLHDLFVNLDAVTPGEYKQRGTGLDIYYGFHRSPFGICLLATTERGICNLSFIQDGGRESLLEELRQRFPSASIREDSNETSAYIEKIFGQVNRSHETKLDLFLQGTNFQIKVWEALLRIPSGSISTYGKIAEMIESPKSARAVGQAVGSNPISYIIPCHRVIKKVGDIGEYHWGKARKMAILGREFASAGSISHLEVGT